MDKTNAMTIDEDSVQKYVCGNQMFALRPDLGWLLLGSWGWQPVTEGFVQVCRERGNE